MINITEFKNKIVKKSNVSLLNQLKNEKLPVILWGGGSMSYSVRKILKSIEIKIAACWIDNSPIENLEDGTRVYSYEEICNNFQKFIVVLGHSKYEMADQIAECPEVEKCYCLVNVCYGQWSCLDYSFVEKHMQDYYDACALMDDELSRECLIAFLNTKISEDYHYLLSVCEKETATYFDNPFFEIKDNEYLVDVGAYTGDTIREFVGKHKKYRKIAAIEPDQKSAEELKKYILLQKLANIDVYELGCWNENTYLSFGVDEESSSISCKGTTTIKVMKLDDLLCDKDVSLIKINYLHGVEECIKGAEKILKEKKPKIMIMVGFDEWSLIKLPRLIKLINKEYKLSLRYASAMPARLILFAY